MSDENKQIDRLEKAVDKLNQTVENILREKYASEGFTSPPKSGIIPNVRVKRIDKSRIRLSDCSPDRGKYAVVMKRVNASEAVDKQLIKDFKIVILDAMTMTDSYVNLYKFTLLGNTVFHAFTEPHQVAERIKDANAVITNKVKITAEDMDNAPELVYIGVMATGYDVIDTEYASKSGITVTNVPDYSTDAVAQHTFSLILNHFSKVAQYNNFVQNGGWQRTKLFSPCVYETHELKNKSIGIIGFGKIGRQVAKIASAFNMTVYVCHPRPLTNSDKKKGYHRVSFSHLISYCDVITIHCPLTEDTKNMFNKDVFNRCNSNLYLINTARGAIVNSDDLYYALVNKKISGAALDVLEAEPMSADCKLLNLPNLTITPHVAWGHIESRRRLMNTLYYNLFKFITGHPVHVVNKPGS